MYFCQSVAHLVICVNILLQITRTRSQKKWVILYIFNSPPRRYICVTETTDITLCFYVFFFFLLRRWEELKKTRWISLENRVQVKRNHSAFHNHSSHAQTDPVNVNNQLQWIPHQTLYGKKICCIQWCKASKVEKTLNKINVFIFYFYSAEMSELVIYERELSMTKEDKKKLWCMTMGGKGGLFEEKETKGNLRIFNVKNIVLSLHFMFQLSLLWSIACQRARSSVEVYMVVVASVTWWYLFGESPPLRDELNSCS